MIYFFRGNQLFSYIVCIVFIKFILFVIMTNIGLLNKKHNHHQHLTNISNKNNQPNCQTLQLKSLFNDQSSNQLNRIRVTYQQIQPQTNKSHQLSMLVGRNPCRQRLYKKIMKQRNLQKLTVINRVKSQADITDDFAPYLQRKCFNLSQSINQSNNKSYCINKNADNIQEPNFHKYLLSKINKKSKYQHLKNKSIKRIAKKTLNQTQNYHQQSPQNFHNFTISIVKSKNKSPIPYFNSLNMKQKYSLVEQTKQKMKNLYKNFSFITSESKKSLISQFQTANENQIKKKTISKLKQTVSKSPQQIKSRQQIKKYLLAKNLEKSKQIKEKISKTEQFDKAKTKFKEFPKKNQKTRPQEKNTTKIIGERQMDLIERLNTDVEGWQDNRLEQYSELSEYLNLKKYTQ